MLGSSSEELVCTNALAHETFLTQQFLETRIDATSNECSCDDTAMDRHAVSDAAAKQNPQQRINGV